MKQCKFQAAINSIALLSSAILAASLSEARVSALPLRDDPRDVKGFFTLFPKEAAVREARGHTSKESETRGIKKDEINETLST
jgi:hypothetical protein